MVIVADMGPWIAEVARRGPVPARASTPRSRRGSAAWRLRAATSSASPAARSSARASWSVANDRLAAEGADLELEAGQAGRLRPVGRRELGELALEGRRSAPRAPPAPGMAARPWRGRPSRPGRATSGERRRPGSTSGRPGAPLAGEAIVRVEAEQAAIAVDPRRVVVDEDRAPLGILARADRAAVRPGVVDERDAQGVRDATCEVARVVLAERVTPEDRRASSTPADRRARRDRRGGQVLAMLEVGRVGACSGMDDRMVALADEQRIVPAASEVVA